ncbi:MAG: hypothetical protein ACOC7S_00020 [Planctomycetota bacterium]
MVVDTAFAALYLPLPEGKAFRLWSSVALDMLGKAASAPDTSSKVGSV